jgi:hypothetical protein
MAVRLSALRAGHPLPPGRFLVFISVKRLSRPNGHNAAGRITLIEKNPPHRDSNQFFSAPSLLTLTTSNFFQLNPCGISPYVTSSLIRGWVCRLQLLLVLARAVILGSESHGTHDDVLLTPPTRRARSLYLYPPGTGWFSYTPRHWVPFSSQCDFEFS